MGEEGEAGEALEVEEERAPTQEVYPGTPEPVGLPREEISYEERELFLQVASEQGSHELHRRVQLLARSRRDAEARGGALPWDAREAGGRTF